MYFTQHFTSLITFFRFIFMRSFTLCFHWLQSALPTLSCASEKHSPALFASSEAKCNEREDIVTNWRLLKNISISVGIFPAFQVLALRVVLGKVGRCQRYTWVIERKKSTDYTFVQCLWLKQYKERVSVSKILKIWAFLLPSSYFKKNIVFSLIWH